MTFKEYLIKKINMKRKIFYLIFLFFNIFNLFTSLCFGQSNQTQIRAKTILDFKGELSLTEDQVQKIRKIIDDFEKEAKPLREKIILLDKEIRELLEKGGDMKVVRKKVKDIFSLRADLVLLEIEAGRKIDNLLTEEQLKKWREIKFRR